MVTAIDRTVLTGLILSLGYSFRCEETDRAPLRAQRSSHRADNTEVGGNKLARLRKKSRIRPSRPAFDTRTRGRTGSEATPHASIPGSHSSCRCTAS